MLNLLGKGGFACVYRARSNKTGLEVAIKMVGVKRNLFIFVSQLEILETPQPLYDAVVGVLSRKCVS